MNTPSLTRHVLRGLAPEPLASYLAGLGLTRVLSEQADPAAAAAWTEDGLAVTTTVGDLAAWLAEDYVPTPVLSPWNNGSGFGPKDKEPKRTLAALRDHPSPRLAPLRDAIPVAARAAACGGDKRQVVQEFRNHCPDALLPWIDATVVLAGQAETFFPPLLGTGGNDGRLDFSTNFHQRLLDVLDTKDAGMRRSLAWAHDLLDGTQTQPLSGGAVGQFDPAAAGGPGSSAFGAADSRVNPWGYVLLVEGALLFAASAVRRNEHDAGRAAIPFTVCTSPDGSASGAEGEESRGEIWAPVWHRDFTLAEIGQLFGEARASWRGRPARRAVDFYAATRTLGVTRGVSEFVRYGLHQRNGLAYAAVPLDRVQVRTDSRVKLIESVEDWPARLRRPAPTGPLSQALRRFDAAQMRYARETSALALRDLLAALTTLELAAGRSGRGREAVAPRRDLPAAGRFLPILAGEGVPAELRVAAGLASCATLPGPDRARQPARTMCQILLPVDPIGPSAGARPSARWRETPIVGGFGLRPLPNVLADVLEWRSRTAPDEPSGQAFRGVPTFRIGVPVPAADLHDLARGRLDAAELDLWLRACLSLNWRGTRWEWPQRALTPPVPTLGLLHPLAAGLRVGTGRQNGQPPPEGEHPDAVPRLALNPDWPIRLAAGRAADVHHEAVARLRQAGWQAVPTPPAATFGDGTLMAAALVPRVRGYDPVLRMLAVPLRNEEPDN